MWNEEKKKREELTWPRGEGLRSISVTFSDVDVTTRTPRPITGPQQHSYQSLFSPRIIRALTLVAREHRRLRVGLQTRLALPIEEEKERDREREREREPLRFFRERPSSRIPFCQKRIKRGKRNVFLCSVVFRPFVRLSISRQTWDIRSTIQLSNPLEDVYIYIDYQFDNEGMEIFIATIFTSTRFDPEIVVLGGKMADG